MISMDPRTVGRPRLGNYTSNHGSAVRHDVRVQPPAPQWMSRGGGGAGAPAPMASGPKRREIPNANAPKPVSNADGLTPEMVDDTAATAIRKHANPANKRAKHVPDRESQTSKDD